MQKEHQIQTTTDIDTIDIITPDNITLVPTSDITNIVRELSATEAKHLFTALRKAANHPLLLRIRYNDEAVLNKIAQVALAAGYFGSQCDITRVMTELETFSDYDIHSICLQYSSSLSEYILPSEALYDSPKMCILKSMLPKLIVSSISSIIHM